MSKIFWSKAMYNTIVYEKPREKVARVSLNRPESRNAQDTTLLHELNDAFDKAAHDDTVSVIILAANGPHFSSGHDLREPDLMKKLNDFRPVGTWSNFGAPGAEGWRPLTCNDDEMTCPLPADETVVEVMLNDGSICRAWYSCNIMEAGDWDFLPVGDEDEPDDEADSIADKIVAWRPAAPENPAKGGE